LSNGAHSDLCGIPGGDPISGYAGAAQCSINAVTGEEISSFRLCDLSGVGGREPGQALLMPNKSRYPEIGLNIWRFLN
jgi:hypothetical protein